MPCLASDKCHVLCMGCLNNSMSQHNRPAITACNVFTILVLSAPCTLLRTSCWWRRQCYVWIFALRPNCNHVYDEVCSCASNLMCKSIGNIDRLDQVTIVYLEPATCSQASMAPKCIQVTLCLYIYLSPYQCTSALMHANRMMRSFYVSWIWILFKLFQLLKGCRYELVNFADTHSQTIGTQLSKDVRR